MSKGRVEELVLRIAEDVTKDTEFEIVDVEYEKAGDKWYLRVFADKPGGITVDECGLLSGKLSNELDRVDPIPHSYVLEVSSPGLERPLKKDEDFERFAGRPVEINTFAPLCGQKEWQGVLKGLRDGDVVVESDGEEIAIPREKVAKARLTVDF